MTDPTILTVNGGSSSLKFALFDRSDPPRRLMGGKLEGLGRPDASMTVTGADGRREVFPVEAADLASAADELIGWLGRKLDVGSIAAVGHRVVHGGPRHFAPEIVTDGLIDDLRLVRDFDPEHMPGELALIDAMGRLVPDRPQIACFDTDFHRDLPRIAQALPIPRRFEAEGVRRYGFHGLSYTYLLGELGRIAGGEAARGRLVLAHLGSGASMAAVRDGRCMDTSMGLTPAAGLVMGTRSGDIDPGLVRFLMRDHALTPEQFDHLVNHESGLLGLSETSPDVRDLLAREGDDARAAEAVAVFCYQARKWVGAYAAAMGGLDTLVFAGGIGENAPAIRARICDGLPFLGIEIDPARNAAGAPVISPDGSTATVRIIPTDEEAVIARAVASILARTPEPH